MKTTEEIALEIEKEQMAQHLDILSIEDLKKSINDIALHKPQLLDTALTVLQMRVSKEEFNQFVLNNTKILYVMLSPLWPL